MGEKTKKETGKKLLEKLTWVNRDAFKDYYVTEAMEEVEKILKQIIKDVYGV